MTWRDEALCQVASPALFDLEQSDERLRRMAIDLARRWCAVCPVATACLAEALLDDAGLPAKTGPGTMRGGLTGRQRTALAAAHGARPSPAQLAGAVASAGDAPARRGRARPRQAA